NNVIAVHLTTNSSTNTPSSSDLQHQLSDHDDHQEDDAPPKGKKRAKRRKLSKSSKYARGSSSKQPAQRSKTYEEHHLLDGHCDHYCEKYLSYKDQTRLKTFQTYVLKHPTTLDHQLDLKDLSSSSSTVDVEDQKMMVYLLKSWLDVVAVEGDTVFINSLENFLSEDKFVLGDLWGGGISVYIFLFLASKLPVS
nr:hypothetical protein [Tanacetum cinerariifolium]